MGEKISKQIAVYKNKNGLLETINCLKPAPKEKPWHIHAGGKKEGYSLIRLVAVDYSKGTGKRSVSAYANLLPEDVWFLYMRLCFGFEQVSLEQQKIYNDKEKDGIVTILKITRSDFGKNGERRDNPWIVNIRNGTGMVAYNRNGGQYCKKGSFEEKKNVNIYLDDLDFFRLLYRTCAVIQAFEQKELYREREVKNFQTLYRLIKRDLEALVFRLREPRDREHPEREAA